MYLFMVETGFGEHIPSQRGIKEMMAWLRGHGFSAKQAHTFIRDIIANYDHVTLPSDSTVYPYQVWTERV